MNVYITFDYEIFFGFNHGTIEKSLLYPTEKILEIGKKQNAQFTFFIDCGFLIKLNEYKSRFPNLDREYQLVTQQIKKIKSYGHDCELHIHPHWEKTFYDGEKWIFDYDYYKLSDFSDNEITEIFSKYSKVLESITQQKPKSFRAGGWCIQPFSRMKKGFLSENLQLDSSVFQGGKNVVTPYYYDYTTAPAKDYWRFENDVCIENKNGRFIELPISSYKYSPLFFWRLFILGNILPKQHKPLGDGKPMPSNITRKKMLTKFHFMSAAVDGYFVSKVSTILKRNKNNKFKHTVLLGHPKAATNYSLKKTDKLIEKYKTQYNFVAFSQFNTEK